MSHKILRIAHLQPALQNNFNKELGISPILAQVLINRGITSLTQAEQFLNTSPEDLLDPYSFSQMHKAVERIKSAAVHKEKVMVYGDYDVDGITALALLKEALLRKGIDVTHYLPHRVKEGYGLTKNICRIAKEKDVKLIITVDCGTSNQKEIEELKRHRIDTIITDHHEPSGELLPQALAIINPKIKEANYKFRDLAGVGVAYKLAQALEDSLLLEELDLVALGTIADSVPLSGENRVIVKEGLQRIPLTKRPGLKVLIKNAGLEDKKFTATFVSFILGPRINASGRMDTADTSLKLLMSGSEEEAAGLAKIVEQHNRERQKVENRILEEAQDLIDKEINFKEHKVIVLAKENWHQGVLGIVASKLADRFCRPAIVISMTEDLCKGSARSIKNFHLFDALIHCKEFLNSFGGHSHAAGLVITKDNIEDFKRSINRIAHEKLSLEDLLPGMDIDMELSFSDFNEEAVAEMERLEPFGAGNPEPLFYTKDLKLRGEPQALGRETLKFWATDGNFTFQAIGFGMSSLKESLEAAGTFDLVYTPRMDNWRGETGVLLEVKDIFFR